MITFNVKRTTDKSGLTVYNICLGDVVLHAEYSRKSADIVKEQLEDGALLSDILSCTLNRQKKAFESEKNALFSSQQKHVSEKAKLEETIHQLKTDLEKSVSHQSGERMMTLSTSTFTLNEVCELTAYCGLFLQHGFKRHWDVNEYLDMTDGWGRFPIIRSLNTHANGYTVNGILKRYYAIVCQILEIGSDKGTPLISSDHY